jgi:hypothetical protein
MNCGRRVALTVASILSALLLPPAASAVPSPGLAKVHAVHAMKADAAAESSMVTDNFRLLGHHDLGMTDVNGDVWVHGNFAYVGTWAIPCTGTGVRIVDVSDLRDPELIGTLAGREGTDAEDMVVRRVSTEHFSGDLIAVGIQRCDFENPELDEQEFGLELWDVTDPSDPEKLSEFAVGHGSGGVHELDLFQRGDNVYALLAHPFGEWFDPSGMGDFMIVDVTNPRFPVLASHWGAGANGLSPGPFWGQGDFGAMFAHSARASADGTKAYVSYWDLGVLTFDISDVGNPVLLTRTTYKPWEDGDAHSMTPYSAGGRSYILENDEDLSPETPSDIRYGPRKHGLGNPTPSGTPLWLEPGHQVVARVVAAANQGCSAGDYPAATAGKIAVVRTPFPFFDAGGEEPQCLQAEQEAAAEAAGAVAVVHDFVADNTSPQWFDVGEVDIPVLFTDHATAQGMVRAGWAKLKARKPSWGYLRIYDAETGRQVAKFDRAPHVGELPAPPGVWTIHNTEVRGERAYSSWYSNGIVALDLRSLNRRSPGDPKMVGQFVPPPTGEDLPFTGMWGVVIRADGVIFGSDLGSGLWIVKPTGKAAP